MDARGGAQGVAASLSQHFLHLGESSLILIRTGKRAATRKYRSTKRFSSEVDI